MPTFKWTFAADDAGASKAMKEFAASVKAAEAATDSGAKKMSADLEKVAAAAAKSQKSISSATTGGLSKTLSQGVGSLVASNSSLGGNILGQFGGTEALLGGVSAGAAVATAGLAVAGAAVVKFGVDSVHAFTSAAASVDKFQDVAGGTAEQASVFVGAAQQLGVSTDALSASVGKMLKGVNANEVALRSYGATVVRTASGNVDSVATFESIARAYANTEDPAKRAELGALAFGRGYAGIIDILERGGPVLDSFFRSAAAHAPMFHNQDLQAAVDLQRQTVELGQEWTKFKVNVGEKITPPLTDVLKDLTDFGVKIGEADAKWTSFAKDVTEKKAGDPWYVTGLKEFNKLLEAAVAGQSGEGPLAKQNKEMVRAKAVTDDAKSATLANYQATGLYYTALRQATGGQDDLAIGSTFTTGKLYQVADAFSAAAKAASGAFTSAQIEGIAATDDYESALSALDSTFDQAGQDQQSYADTSSKSAEQIADAQDSVTQALQGVADAQADYQKAVLDAQQSVADVEESSSKRIVDAQNAVTDARKRAQDQAVSSARRVEDATQAVRDAETAALRDNNPYDASRKREDAELGLKRALEDSANDQQDSAKGIGDAQTNLADTEQQAAKDRTRAQQQAADQIASAQKRIQDANDQVAEANKRLARSTDEAGAANDRAAAKVSAHTVTQQQYDQAVQKSMDATPAYILDQINRGVPMDQINTKLQTGVDKLRAQGRELGLNTQLADIYGTHLDDAALKVLELGASINYSARQLGVDPGILAGDAASAGLDLDKAFGIAESHDTGGWLRPGVSLVKNLTGVPERVLSPSEMAATGGNTTINIGHVLDARGLASLLADLNRQGYITLASKAH